MLAELFRTRQEPRVAAPVRPERDPSYAARARLIALRDRLLQVARRAEKKRRWREPAVFFFDPTRQAELEAARQPVASPRAELEEAIVREVAALCQSVEVRRMARAVPGLLAAARALPATAKLAEVLALPDDETVLVLEPKLRIGYRLHIRGVADANQFQIMMLDAIGDDLPAEVRKLPQRFGLACQDANPVIPAGVPMAAELPYQFLRPGALDEDGTVPAGFAACSQWLWGWESLAAAPRIDGERVILLSEPAFPQIWEVERKYPAMAAEVNLVDVLGPFQAAERLGRIVGRPVPVQTRTRREPELARAA